MNKLKTLLMIVIMLTAIILPVYVQAATVKISKAKATLEVDATLKLKITGTSSKTTWTTSKKSVATIGNDGTVTAILEGQTTITATVSKKKYTCIVTVVNSQQEQVTAEKGTITELTTGLYIMGEDFPAGKYNVKTISGSGNFFVDSSDDYVNEIMSEEGNETFDTHTYNNLRLLYGDEMKISGGVVLEFTKLD